MEEDLERKIKETALANGAAACGITRADTSEEYLRWASLAAKAPEGLDYLKKRGFLRGDMNLWFRGAKSVIICLFPYWDGTRDYPAELTAVGDAAKYLAGGGRIIFRPELLSKKKIKIARYAMNADLRKTLPAARFRIFCDNSPVMEKELARSAGLGFIGRNTLLISPELGSFVNIGGIAVDVELKPDGPLPETAGCGDCRLCEKICPGKALEDYKISQENCISYWTTQKTAQPLPKSVSESDFVYGCDICQENCPFNKRLKKIIPRKDAEGLCSPDPQGRRN